MVMGDVIGDASINSKDVAAVQKHLLGKTMLVDAFLLAAEYNNDGKVNSRDIAALQKAILIGIFE